MVDAHRIRRSGFENRYGTGGKAITDWKAQDEMVTTQGATIAIALGVALGVGAAVGWVLSDRTRQQQQYNDKPRDDALDSAAAQIEQLRAEVARQQQLRAQERSGRINGEREAREVLQRQQEQDGFPFVGIGHVQSCYADRRGTPRQGTLVPSARGRIKFSTRVSPAALESLQHFSHLWIVFVFHENTNAPKAFASGSNGNSRSTYQAKIAPPRLGGKKVGVFATRSPHRPNSIGLSVVKIDKVYGRYVDISGHDLVDGTPVLDIKPYVPMDCVRDHICPDWVGHDTVDVVRPVDFAPEAVQGLERLVQQHKLRFYYTLAEIQAAIADTLKLDIRSVHQGRGRADATQVFQCHLDNVDIAFQTLEDKIHVVGCSYFKAQ